MKQIREERNTLHYDNHVKQANHFVIMMMCVMLSLIAAQIAYISQESEMIQTIAYGAIILFALKGAYSIIMFFRAQN